MVDVEYLVDVPGMSLSMSVILIITKCMCNQLVMSKLQCLVRSTLIGVGRFWTIAEKELTSRYGVVGDVGTLQTACSVAFLDRAHAVSGMQDGSIYLWKTSAVIHNLTGAHSKPIMQLVCREDLIYSGSRDGVVRLWTFSLAQKGAGREFLTLVGSINCREMMQKIHLKQETENLLSPASPQLHSPTNEGSKGLHARPVSISSLVVRLSEETLFATITVGLDSNEVYQVRSLLMWPSPCISLALLAC